MTVDRDDPDDSFDAALAARICWHYFKENQTQDFIAKRLKITRKRVNRMLGEARERGLVQITIQRPLAACSELEARLIKDFALRQAVVVPAPISDTDVRTLVGAAAGEYISNSLARDAALGISWGGTINAAAQTRIVRLKGFLMSEINASSPVAILQGELNGRTSRACVRSLRTRKKLRIAASLGSWRSLTRRLARS